MVHTKLYQIPLKILNSKKFIIQSCLAFRYPSIIIENNRSYLTNAYKCDDKWNNRLEDPLIKTVKPTEFYYDLLRKYKAEGKVSAVDADIFLNAVNEKYVEKFSEELEEVVRLLRRSPETTNTLPSTTHAFIRAVLDSQKYDLLFKVLTDPLNYGVFLDFYTSNLLMNTFIKDENYTAAARIASCSMLEEDYGPPLTQTFVMLSCFKYIFNDKENEPWIDYHEPDVPEEEIKILVKYVRNPHFDDHFDLREPLHIVGKTLAWLSFSLEDEVLKANAEILGWSLYEKWSQLESLLNALRERKQELDEVVVSKINDQISNCCKDSEMQTKLSSLMSYISKENLVSNLNIIEKIEENLKNYVTEYENEIIEEQKNTYDKWIVKRKEAIEEQLDLIERRKLIEEIKSKKEDLERREDVIFFFENQNKFDLLTKEKKEPKNYKMKHGKKLPLREKTTEKEEGDYYPPEV